ncbi:HD domain-containing phosphohydrolase [Peribacillus simplex]|uniref:HD domain-containing phosphohydrolase n=2 Tax=Peribacillus TaxID=2675229 RepID=A0AA90PCN0_9BACI|nr:MULTISPECIES: HD domain-containing phosphohydrolase [Peribacillus]MDP1417010.1 HD domain-containing phosphohydrolase [Peribacillus simplex]MDP1449665.1 HD domain-containing phosphohydrolase [Peribacillus frigoritolerans]
MKNVHTVSLLVANCANQHHERLDGSGYPRGLKGDESIISARSLPLPMCLMPLLPIGFTVSPCCRIRDWKSFMRSREKVRQYDHRGFPQGDCHLS